MKVNKTDANDWLGGYRLLPGSQPLGISVALENQFAVTEDVRSDRAHEIQNNGMKPIIADLQGAPLRLRSPCRLNDGFQNQIFWLEIKASDKRVVQFKRLSMRRVNKRQ
jgi:hypothetical protein